MLRGRTLDARIFTADNKDIGAVCKVDRQTADPGGAVRTPDNALRGIGAGLRRAA